MQGFRHWLEKISALGETGGSSHWTLHHRAMWSAAQSGDTLASQPVMLLSWSCPLHVNLRDPLCITLCVVPAYPPEWEAAFLVGPRVLYMLDKCSVTELHSGLGCALRREGRLLSGPSEVAMKSE